MLPLVNLYRQKINTTFHIFLSLAGSAFHYLSHVRSHMVFFNTVIIWNCILSPFSSKCVFSLLPRLPSSPIKVSLSLSLTVSLSFSHPSPVFLSPQSWYRSRSNDYVKACDIYSMCHERIYSTLATIQPQTRTLALSAMPSFKATPHSLSPTYIHTHTHSQSTFTVWPAVALQGVWPLTLSSKVWGLNHQAARSVKAEPAISASYWHNCHIHTHTHMHTSCLRLCIMRWFYVYRLNRETYGSRHVWVCFML